MLVSLALANALAADVEQHLTWTVALDGTPIGKRELTLKYAYEDDGTARRFFEVWSELDANVLGLQYAVRQRIAGQALRGPAAFSAVTKIQDDTVEVQGRVDGAQWFLMVATNGREWTKDLPRTSVDLSTVDLMDPVSRVGLDGLTVARVLAAETGDILEGDVKPAGTQVIHVGTVDIPVTGYTWTPDEGAMRFWYSPDGYLVRYETEVMGRWIVGTLTAPPPKGTDEAPVHDSASSGISEVPL